MDSISCSARALALLGLWGSAIALAHAGAVTQASHASMLTPARVRATRTEVSLQASPRMPDGRTADRRFSITRWSETGVGLSFGIQSTPFTPLTGMSGAASMPWAPQLGVHWRRDLSSRWRVELSGWAQFTPLDTTVPWADQDGQGGWDTYTARVEVQWQSARYRGLIPEYGAVGVQLQGGSRLMLRARHGGPMVYYRMRF